MLEGARSYPSEYSRMQMSNATTVQLHLGSAVLPGDLSVPDNASGVVLFAHGSGSSRFSPRNQRVAGALQRAGFATLLLDLLTADEEQVDLRDRRLRFDIELLTGRLTEAVDWLAEAAWTAALPVGTFGASTGAAAALIAAAQRADRVRAVVSRGGRPDLAGEQLGAVRAPVLLIVGGADPQVLVLNERAAQQLGSHVLEVVPGATHLFEEPGTLERVMDLAVSWFRQYLSMPPALGQDG
jgi:putative phosphoribosyl transferase